MYSQSVYAPRFDPGHRPSSHLARWTDVQRLHQQGDHLQWAHGGLPRRVVQSPWAETDEWLAQTLANPTIRTLADAVYTLKDRATAAFRAWARPAEEKARHHLMFGAIAWARPPGRKSSRVFFCFVSNCHDEHGVLQADARADFRVHHRILEPGDFHGFSNIGAALSIEERHRLKERTRRATTLDDLTAGLVEA